jgi:hypothetical protein
MMIRSPVDVNRLARVCGLFGSDHLGERAAAAAQADKIVRNAGLTWPDVLAPQPLTPSRSSRNSCHVSKITPGEILARHNEILSGWERGFLSSPVRRSSWSPRQREILNEIRERVAGTNK